jgi:hypothetical protein
MFGHSTSLDSPSQQTMLRYNTRAPCGRMQHVMTHRHSVNSRACMHTVCRLCLRQVARCASLNYLLLSKQPAVRQCWLYERTQVVLIRRVIHSWDLVITSMHTESHKAHCQPHKASHSESLARMYAGRSTLALVLAPAVVGCSQLLRSDGRQLRCGLQQALLCCCCCCWGWCCWWAARP